VGGQSHFTAALCVCVCVCVCVKYPIADATDAPQTSGFLCNPCDEYEYFSPFFRVMEHRWKETDSGKQKYSGKTRPSATLCGTNPSWTDPGLNPRVLPWPLCPSEGDETLGAPRSRAGWIRKISSIPGFEIQTVQLAASRSTDCVASAAICSKIRTKCISHYLDRTYNL
jgi:hypothetical protein